MFIKIHQQNIIVIIIIYDSKSDQSINSHVQNSGFKPESLKGSKFQW